MRFDFRILLIISFMLNCEVIFSRISFNSDTIHLDQKTVSYIYNRALDITLRHSNVLNRRSKKFLFNPSKDTVFVQPEIVKSIAVTPRYDESTELIHNVNIKNLYHNIIFTNSMTIIKKIYNEKVRNLNNPNLTISFSDLFEYNNLLYLIVNVIGNDTDKEFPESGSSRLILELDFCENNYILFRKLYSNVEYELSGPDVPLIMQNTNEEIKLKDTILEDGLHFYRLSRNGYSTLFYEFDLGDKKCDN